jgi:endonuclease/exonuclease/phosphatase family metal-dependent hydrolase
MTQNLFIGVDVASILSVDDPTEVADAIDGLLKEALASDFPARAEAIARTIAEYAPDVIGVQEAAVWRVQSPPDSATTPAETVAIDFLEVLLDALRAQGLSYEAASVRDGVDLEVSGNTQDVRLTDRDVLLVREGIEVEAATAGDYETNVVVPSPLEFEVAIPRGWAAVDVLVDDTRVRIVNTHLEVLLFAGVQEVQAAELRAGPAGIAGPLVVLGDMNAGPSDTSIDTYSILLGDDLEDAWVQGGAELLDPTGATCCYATTLEAEARALSRRIDIVAVGGGARAVAATRVTDEPSERTTADLWASDHAGVVVTIDVP